MTERKNEAHDMVMESLTQALLQLMEKKPLSKINVSELCTRAGVGRVSFYRNFDSMDDILVQHLKNALTNGGGTSARKMLKAFIRTSGRSFWSSTAQTDVWFAYCMKTMRLTSSKITFLPAAAPHLRSMRKSLIPGQRWRVRCTVWWMNGSSGEWAACRRISASGKLSI